jgi:hypothetical protein
VRVTALLETQFCVTPLCVDEALPGLRNCRRHASITEIRGAHEGSDGLAALEAMDRGEQQAIQAETMPETTHRDVDANGRWGCKIAGCEGRSERNTGPTAYLCEAHAVTARRAARDRKLGKPRSAKPSGRAPSKPKAVEPVGTPDPVEDKPAPHPETPSEAPPVAERSLAEVASELEAAQQAADEATARLTAALSAFRTHPTVIRFQSES